jgi:dTDP-4-dehydrorhamnose reductase
MHTDIPKTAVIGASGLLGRYFLSAYRRVFPDCIGTVKETPDESRNIHNLDLCKPDITKFRLAEKQYKEALILAAVTKVNIPEEEKIEARKVNVEGTLELIRQLVEEGIKPVYFSSSYVFDGQRGGYTDESPINPVIEYGRQKAVIESKIAAIAKGNFLVVRMSKIFSLVKEDNTFLDEIARVLLTGGTYRAAFDQILCPTLITDLIDVVSLLQSRGSTGFINVCSPEAWSRYDLAVALAKSMGISADKVTRASLSEIMKNPKYPKNTSMVSKVMSASGLAVMPISACIERTARNWTSRDRATGKIQV